MFTKFTVDYMTLFGVWTAICAYSTINTLERSPNGMCSNFTKSKVELQIKNWMQNIFVSTWVWFKKILYPKCDVHGSGGSL